MHTCGNLNALTTLDPRTSDEAKEHAQEVLNATEQVTDDVDPVRRAAGFKATLHSQSYDCNQI
jgi:hypothetical protein